MTTRAERAKAERAELRAAQLTAVTDALTDAALKGEPGLTVYVLGMHVPIIQPGTAEPGVLASSAPLSLVIKLLAELEQAGTVRQEPCEGGARWHLTGPAVAVLPCARIHGGRVVLVGSRHSEFRGSPGWVVRHLDAAGSAVDDVFINRVIAGQAAEAIRAGSFDRAVFRSRDLALAEGVTA
jgi:hypothetical protein